jgi:bifunctional NMN adenylyltransferase/nudix hydrolase
MKKQYEYIIYIGRMEPPTKAHIANIKKALSLSTTVLVMLGSCNQPRTIKNPWNFIERSSMVFNQLDEIDHPRIKFIPLIDYRYNDQEWISQVQHEVKKATSNQVEPTIGIIGCKKDQSSYYLDYFPQWDFIEMDTIEDIDASTVRSEYFEGRLLQWRDKELISPALTEYLKKWSQTPEYDQLKREYKFIADYKRGWQVAPYPPIFVTVDAIVIQSGHILLIKRRSIPGEGLYALPGGFVNQDETLLDAAIRELREETKLKVPTPVLLGSLKAQHVFDNPGRSLRGRTITHAFVFSLKAGPLCKVKGNDDAAVARWIPIDSILDMENYLFEDHIDIIRYGINNSGE